MVTFKLIEQTAKELIYHYYPEGKENEGYGIIRFDMSAQESEIVKMASNDSERIITKEELNSLRESVNRANIENGEPELTEEEWPIATEDEIIGVYADHAIAEIERIYDDGRIPKEGIQMWY